MRAKLLNLTHKVAELNAIMGATKKALPLRQLQVEDRASGEPITMNNKTGVKQGPGRLSDTPALALFKFRVLGSCLPAVVETPSPLVTLRVTRRVPLCTPLSSAHWQRTPSTLQSTRSANWTRFSAAQVAAQRPLLSPNGLDHPHQTQLAPR
jgi:hypothetical protein